MKVKIDMTVAVDLDEWAETYGLEKDSATVRDDVKRWAANAVAHHPDGLVELMRDR
jgi:hypothetical protein